MVCGVATGYPPYQYMDDFGNAIGMDVVIAKEVAARLGRELVVRQEPWDDVVTLLRLERIDFISGMEINTTRKLLFDFTDSYYVRKVAVFTLATNRAIEQLYDLKWKVITGDRHSYVEELFEDLGLKRKIRIHQTRSKDESMLLLKKREAVAMVAPVEVAAHLATKYNVRLKVLDDSDPGSPVGMAVTKGNSILLDQIKEALLDMERDGTLGTILRHWRGGLSVTE